MPPPQASLNHYRSQQRLQMITEVAARRAWRRMGSDFDATWPRVRAQLMVLLRAAQIRAARDGATYVADVLEEMGLDAPAEGNLQPEAFAGVASDGRPLDTLLYGAVVEAKRVSAADGDAPPMAPSQALSVGQSWLDMAVETQVADASRAAVQTVIASRIRLGGYVRMVNAPACGRCIILAGRFYRYNTGFQRHPRCDCTHIPALEDTADEVGTEPGKLFRSMTVEQQDKAFGRAGAESIRLGADPGQVVNARRGMQTAVLNRRSVLTTTEGVTKRGVFGGSDFAQSAGYNARRVGRRGYIEDSVERTTKRARLMPETILRHATDRDDAVRLLKLYGFIL